MLEAILIVAGVFFLNVGYCIWKRSGKISRRLLRGLVFLAIGVSLGAGALLAVAGVGLFWRGHRPRPDNVARVLFEGIAYTRDVRSEPRPTIVHVLTVDLKAPGIRFLVTPGESIRGKQMPARTTSEFLAHFGVQAAVNGDCFDPCRSDGLLDYYPRSGDPVNVLGNAASEGRVYSSGRRDDLTLHISRDNRVRLGKPIGEAYNAISGTHVILKGGRIPDGLPGTVHPRTAVAIDRKSETLLLLVVDGRQAGYSLGVTLEELAGIILEYGGDTALNLDGGGSSALVVEDESGKPTLLNTPVHTRIPAHARHAKNVGPPPGICGNLRKIGSAPRLQPRIRISRTLRGVFHEMT